MFNVKNQLFNNIAKEIRHMPLVATRASLPQETAQLNTRVGGALAATVAAKAPPCMMNFNNEQPRKTD